MRKIKDVLRLKYEANLSCRQIAASLKLSVGVISKYTKAAEAAALSWPLPDGMDDTTLEARLFPPVATAREHVMPDCAHIHQELKRKGVTLLLLWEEYLASCAGQAYKYAQFCVHYRQYSSRLKLSMRQTHKAGEKLFVDYSGDGVPIVDPQTGEISLTQIFVAVLGASGYTFAEATLTQRLPDWLSLLPWRVQPVQALWRRPVGSGVRAGARHRVAETPDDPVDSGGGTRSSRRTVSGRGHTHANARKCARAGVLPLTLVLNAAHPEHGTFECAKKAKNTKQKSTNAH